MRKGSYRLGEAFGIGVYVHWSFALLLAYVLFSTLSVGAGWAIAINYAYYRHMRIVAMYERWLTAPEPSPADRNDRHGPNA